MPREHRAIDRSAENKRLERKHASLVENASPSRSWLCRISYAALDDDIGDDLLRLVSPLQSGSLTRRALSSRSACSEA